MSSQQNPLHESTHTQTPQPQKPPLSSQESKKSEAHLEKPHDEAVSASPEEEEEGAAPPPQSDGTVTVAEENGRERLKRHRVEMAGRVWIPDMWGQEDLLKDWIDCAAFDASLVNSSILMARDSLARQGRRAGSTGLKIQN